jgi:hypothetical protein
MVLSMYGLQPNVSQILVYTDMQRSLHAAICACAIAHVVARHIIRIYLPASQRLLPPYAMTTFKK